MFHNMEHAAIEELESLERLFSRNAIVRQALAEAKIRIERHLSIGPVEYAQRGGSRNVPAPERSYVHIEKGFRPIW